MKHAPDDLRILPVSRRGEPICVNIDGEEVDTYAGETILSVLLASGRRTLRYTDKKHEPRGVFCGMGLCYECLVTVDGETNVRACVTSVEDGMQIKTGGAGYGR